MVEQTRKRKSTAIATVSAFALLAGLAVFSFDFTINAPFTTELWKRGSYTRLMMYRNLRQHHKLEGHTKEDALALLGQPDRVDKSLLQYNLSQSGSLNMAVYLKDDRVTKLDLRTDPAAIDRALEKGQSESDKDASKDATAQEKDDED